MANIFEKFREQCIAACGKAVPDKAAKRLIGDSAHYMACMDAIAALPLPVMPEQAEPVAYITETAMTWLKEIGVKTYAQKQCTFSSHPFKQWKIPLFSQSPYVLLAEIQSLKEQNQKLSLPYSDEAKLGAWVQALQYGALLCDRNGCQKEASTISEIINAFRKIREAK